MRALYSVFSFTQKLFLWVRVQQARASSKVLHISYA